MTPLSLILTGNEPRQRFLFEALAARVHVAATINFDAIDLTTKLAAAALSLSWPRSEWWENYQMHPLIQRRRRRVLARALEAVHDRFNGLLMWGSWFQPSPTQLAHAPYFNYIDQSRTLANLPGETRGYFARRLRSHELQARTYDASAGIFCMSEWARNQTLESHRVDPNKVIAVGWGLCSIDLSEESFADVPREPLVLHISNDFHRKGIDFLEATARRVRSAIPESRFVVIGEDVGGARPPSTEHVQFVGRITSREALSNYFRKASVFFLPHRFDRSPHVLAEAMSAALPLVTSAQGGAIELVKDKATGFLVTAGDIDGYTESIIALLRDADLRQYMGENSQRLMKAKYNWRMVAATIEHTISASVGRVVYSDTLSAV